MTVGHGIGLGVGSTEAVAVVQASDAPLADPPVLVEPATLRVSPTAATLGAPADEPGVLSGFVARVGDAEAVAGADGTGYLAEDLVATATASLLATAVRHFPGLPADPTVVATHPARWSETLVAAQRAAFDRTGLSAVMLVPDAAAAVRWYQADRNPADGAVVAVCDFAAAGVTVSLVRTGATPLLLPPSTFAARFGGDGIDRMIAEHVLGAADAYLGPIDPADPATRADLDRVRARCRTAKEQLSTATEVVVPVPVGGGASVTLTRADLDEILRGPLEGALSLVPETARAHDLDPAAVSAVLLTGGGAAIPLLSALAEALPAPAVTAPHPGRTATHGAAILAAGGAGVPAIAGAAGVGAAAGAIAAGDSEADTDSLPAVPPPATPTAFTEAGPGRTVQPAAQAAPVTAVTAPAGEPRNRAAMVAGGVGAALVIAALVGAVALSGSDGTAGTPHPHLEPQPTTVASAAPTTTPRRTSTVPVSTAEVAVAPAAPTTWEPLPTAAPAPTTATARPSIPTRTTQARPTTTTATTTTTVPPTTTTTTTVAPTTTTTTTTTMTTTAPAPEPEPEPEPEPDDKGPVAS
ncbi:Hsp70 family protein [Rhodococcus sp. NPDC054953]